MSDDRVAELQKAIEADPPDVEKLRTELTCSGGKPGRNSKASGSDGNSYCLEVRPGARFIEPDSSAVGLGLAHRHGGHRQLSGTRSGRGARSGSPIIKGHVDSDEIREAENVSETGLRPGSARECRRGNPIPGGSSLRFRRFSPCMVFFAPLLPMRFDAGRDPSRRPIAGGVGPVLHVHLR